MSIRKKWLNEAKRGKGLFAALVPNPDLKVTDPEHHFSAEDLLLVFTGKASAELLEQMDHHAQECQTCRKVFSETDNAILEMACEVMGIE